MAEEVTQITRPSPIIEEAQKAYLTSLQDQVQTPLDTSQFAPSVVGRTAFDQAVQQQAAQFAASAPRATPSNQQVGPMGPMASDPRDVLIQNLLRNASLMNRRPV